MGVDFYACDVCGNCFADCGHYVSCDCGRMWCGDSCASDDGYRPKSKTCKFCRKQDATNEELFCFLMKRLGINRRHVLRLWRQNNTEKKDV